MFEACQNLKGSDTPMTDDTTIIAFRQPGSINDPLTGIAREGARRMLMAALKAASLRLCRAVFRRPACRRYPLVAVNALFDMVPGLNG